MHPHFVSAPSPTIPTLGGKLSLGIVLLLLASHPVLAQDNHAIDEMLNQSHDAVAQANQGGGALSDALQETRTNAAAAALPNGATSISETFSDWTVNCAIEQQGKVCAMSQVQGNSQTGQQVFAVELYGTAQKLGEGILVLPFGLDLQTPIGLKAGEVSLGESRPFTTCMPGGCIVPVAFSANEIDVMRQEASASVTARSAGQGTEPVEFSISLAGFTAASNRVVQLLQ